MVRNKIYRWSALLLTLTALAACSHAPGKYASEKGAAGRSIASHDELETVLKRIYHSYLHGQILLEAFDKSLDNEKDPLGTDTYAQLMAVRAHVDAMEERLQEFYLKQVRVLAESQDPGMRAVSTKILKRLNSFMNGYVREGDPALSRAMQVLVLSNIRDSQTELADTLLAFEKEAKSNGRSEAADTYRMYATAVRKQRLDFFKTIKNAKVTPNEVHLEIEKLRGDMDFDSFKHQIEDEGQEMRNVIREARAPASTGWQPSAGPDGNVVGGGFPRGTWSVTYDDGPSTTNSPNGVNTSEGVLANLKAAGVKATFFQLAQQVILKTHIAQEIRDAGMDIGCHSWDHPQVPKLGPDARHHQIEEARAKEEEILGIKIKLYRLPYGAGVSVPSVRQEIANAGLINVFWNVDTLDWQDKNPDSVYQRAMKQINNLGRGVILFHDIHPQSVIASNKVIQTLKAGGNRLCTVQGVVDMMTNNTNSCE